MYTLIAGYGNLGKIYAEAMISQKLVNQNEVFILCRSAKQAREVKVAGHGIPVFAGEIEGNKFEIILIAVKPQDAAGIYDTIQKYLDTSTLVISVMAGIGLNELQIALQHQDIVRAMPNAPICYGLGITGYTAPVNMNQQKLLKAEALLKATGQIVYFENENMLNAVTALSGSGPAYFYYVLQAMTDAGKRMGMDEATATLLVKQTMLGAFFVYDRSGKNTNELITAVASKGGTTEAALKVFDEQKLKETIITGILQAEKRATELGQQQWLNTIDGSR